MSYEINNPSTTRYRRPYVAVWVEDADGFPVRTLVLWLQEGRGARWHRDLTRWYKQDQVRQLVDGTKLIGTVSAATRPPGKYKAVWDGKDDQGHLVPQGKYTLYIEAAREHGTHQLVSETITIGPQRQRGSIEGNTEIKSVQFEYVPRPAIPSRINQPPQRLAGHLERQGSLRNGLAGCTSTSR